MSFTSLISDASVTRSLTPLPSAALSAACRAASASRAACSFAAFSTSAAAGAGGVAAVFCGTDAKGAAAGAAGTGSGALTGAGVAAACEPEPRILHTALVALLVWVRAVLLSSAVGFPSSVASFDTTAFVSAPDAMVVSTAKVCVGSPPLTSSSSKETCAASSPAAAATS